MGLRFFCCTSVNANKVSPINSPKKEKEIKLSFLDENFKGYHYSILFKVLSLIKENQNAYKASGQEGIKKNFSSILKKILSLMQNSQ